MRRVARENESLRERGRRKQASDSTTSREGRVKREEGAGTHDFVVGRMLDELVGLPIRNAVDEVPRLTLIVAVVDVLQERVVVEDRLRTIKGKGVERRGQPNPSLVCCASSLSEGRGPSLNSRWCRQSRRLSKCRPEQTQAVSMNPAERRWQGEARRKHVLFEGRWGKVEMVDSGCCCWAPVGRPSQPRATTVAVAARSEKERIKRKSCSVQKKKARVKRRMGGRCCSGLKAKRARLEAELRQMRTRHPTPPTLSFQTQLERVGLWCGNQICPHFLLSVT